MPTTPILAPVSGTIGEIKKASGSAVKTSDIVIVLCSVKTETNITASTAGTIKVVVQKGDDVKQGDKIAEITS